MTIEKLKYNSAPGHGLMNKTAHELRMDFFNSFAENSECITSTQLTLEEVQHNIESFIGSVEIPLGLAGSLLFKSGTNKTEWLYSGLCTSEGALVASMNRGAKVISECFLSHEVIEKTLRTNAVDMFKLYRYSMGIARFDGIIGGTLNIANTIAGIFAATGQDLGCIHESSLGVLEVDKIDDGLYLSLSIPTLVIGTVGGGTHLPGPKKVLEFMKCFVS